MKEKESGIAEMETENIAAEESLDSVLDKLNSAIKVSDCTDYNASGRTRINDEDVDETDEEASKGNRESNFLQDYLDDRDAFSFLVLSGMKTPNPTPKTSVVSNPVSDGLFMGLVDKVDRTISEERIEDDDISNTNELQATNLANGVISNDKTLPINYLDNGVIQNDNISQVNSTAKQRNRKNTVIDGVLSDRHVDSVESERNTPLTSDPGIDSVGQIAEIDSSADQICKDKQESNSKAVPEDNNTKQDSDLSDLDDASIPDLEIVDESNKLQTTEKDCDIISEKSVAMENAANNKTGSEASRSENHDENEIDANCKINKINDIPSTISQTCNEKKTMTKETKEVKKNNMENASNTEGMQTVQEKNIPTICEGTIVSSKKENENENNITEQVLCSNTEDENKITRSQDKTDICELVQDNSKEISNCLSNEGQNQNGIIINLKEIELRDKIELALHYSDNGLEGLDILNINDVSLPDLEKVSTVCQNSTELNCKLELSEPESNGTSMKEKSMENTADDIKEAENTNIKKVAQEIPIENNVLNDIDKNISRNENNDVHKERLISFFESKNLEKNKKSQKNSRSIKKKAQRKDTKLLMLDNQESRTSTDDFESSLEKPNEGPHSECKIMSNNDQEVTEEMTKDSKEEFTKKTGENNKTEINKETNESTVKNKKDASDGDKLNTQKKCDKEKEKTKQDKDSNKKHAKNANELVTKYKDEPIDIKKDQDPITNNEDSIKDDISVIVLNEKENVAKELDKEETTKKQVNEEICNDQVNEEIKPIIPDTDTITENLNNEIQATGQEDFGNQCQKLICNIKDTSNNGQGSTNLNYANKDIEVPNQNINCEIVPEEHSIQKGATHSETNVDNGRKVDSGSGQESNIVNTDKKAKIKDSTFEKTINSPSLTKKVKNNKEISKENSRSPSSIKKSKNTDSKELTSNQKEKDKNVQDSASTTNKTHNKNTSESIDSQEVRLSPSANNDNAEDTKSNISSKLSSSTETNTKKSVGSPFPANKKNIGSSPSMRKKGIEDKESKKMIGSPSINKKDMSSLSLNKNESTVEKLSKKLTGASSKSKKDMESKNQGKKSKENDPALKKSSSILSRGQKLFAPKSIIEKQEKTPIASRKNSCSQEKPVSFDDLPSNDHIEQNANKHRADPPKGKRPPNRISWMAGKLERSNSQDQQKEVLPARRLSRSNSNLTKENKDYTTILEKVIQDSEENNDAIEMEIHAGSEEAENSINHDKEPFNSDVSFRDCKEDQIIDDTPHLKADLATKKESNIATCDTHKKSSLNINDKKEPLNSNMPINDSKEKHINDGTPHLIPELATEVFLEKESKIATCEPAKKSSLSVNHKKEALNIDEPINDCKEHLKAEIANDNYLQEESIVATCETLNKSSLNVNDKKEPLNCDVPTNNSKEKQINDKLSYSKEVATDKFEDEKSKVATCEIFNKSSLNASHTKEPLNSDEPINDCKEKQTSNDTLKKEKDIKLSIKTDILGIPEVKKCIYGMEEKLSKEIELFISFLANKKEGLTTIESNGTIATKDFIDFIAKKNIKTNGDDSTKDFIEFILSKEKENGINGNHYFLMSNVKSSEKLNQVATTLDSISSKEVKNKKNKNEILMEDDFVELSSNDILPSGTDISHQNNILPETLQTSANLISDDEESITFEDCKSSIDDDIPDLELVAIDFLSDDDHFHDAEKGGYSNSNSALDNSFLDKGGNETFHSDNNLPSNNDFDDSKDAFSSHINVYDVLDAEVNQTPQCQKKIMKGEKENEIKEHKNEKIKRINSSDSVENISFDRIVKERPTSIVDNILQGNIIVQQSSSSKDCETPFQENAVGLSFEKTNSNGSKEQNEAEKALCTNSTQNMNGATTANITENSTNLSTNNVIDAAHVEDRDTQTVSTVIDISSSVTIKTIESCANSLQASDVITDHDVLHKVDMDTIKTDHKCDDKALEVYNETSDDTIVSAALQNKLETGKEGIGSQIYDEQQRKRIKMNRESCLVDTILASSANLDIALSPENSTNLSNTTPDISGEVDCGATGQLDSATEQCKVSDALLDNTTTSSVAIDNQHCDEHKPSKVVSVMFPENTEVPSVDHKMDNNGIEQNNILKIHQGIENTNSLNKESCLVDTILASSSNINIAVSTDNSNNLSNMATDKADKHDCSAKAQLNIDRENCEVPAILLDNITANLIAVDEQKSTNRLSAECPQNKGVPSIDHKMDNKNIEQNKLENDHQHIKNIDKMPQETLSAHSKESTDTSIANNKSEHEVNINQIEDNIAEIVDNDNIISQPSNVTTDESLVNEVLESIATKNENCEEVTEFLNCEDEQKMRIKKKRGSCLVDTILASGTSLNIIMADEIPSTSTQGITELSTNTQCHDKEDSNPEKTEIEINSSFPCVNSEEKVTNQNTLEKENGNKSDQEKHINKNDDLVANNEPTSITQNTSENTKYSEKEPNKKEIQSNNNNSNITAENECIVKNKSENLNKREDVDAKINRKEICEAVLAEITDIVSNPTTRIPSRNSSRNESRDDVNLIGIGDVTSVMESNKKSAASALNVSGGISGDPAVHIEAHNSEQHTEVLLASSNFEEKCANAQTAEDSCTSEIILDSGKETDNTGNTESTSEGNMFIRGTTLMVNNKIISPISSPELILKSNSNTPERKKSSEGRQNSIVDSILANQAQNGEKTENQNMDPFKPQNKTPPSNTNINTKSLGGSITPIKEVIDNPINNPNHKIESDKHIQLKKQFYKDESKTTDSVSDQSCELTEILPLCESMSLSEYMSLKTDESNKDHDELILEMVQNSLKQLDFIELRYRGLNTALEEKQEEAIKQLNIAEENFQECKREYDRGLAVLSTEIINTDSNEERLRGIELVLASEEDAAVKLDRIKMLVTFGTGNVGDRKKLRCCNRGSRKHYMARRRGAPANFSKRKTNHVTINARTKISNITDTKHKEEVPNLEVLPQQSKLKKKTRMKKQITRVSSNTKIN